MRYTFKGCDRIHYISDTYKNKIPVSGGQSISAHFDSKTGEGWSTSPVFAATFIIYL